MIRVLSAGLMTSVQDLGRPGFAHLGVSMAGAADAVALRLANRLVGNREGAPALEITLKGGRFAFDLDAAVSVVGADFACSIPMGRVVWVRSGDVVEIGGCRSGARCYLGVRGGLEAKYNLGSASTHVRSGLGQVVRRGDVLRIGAAVERQPSARVVEYGWFRDSIRLTPGADTGEFDGSCVWSLLGGEWVVSELSDRQGIRLLGGRLDSPGGGFWESAGVALGAIQVPPNGQPVILFVDAQTTGGYPVIANVASVDMPVIGQLRPGSVARFRAVGFAEARALLLEREAWLRDVV